jgi:hypothetical protein
LDGSQGLKMRILFGILLLAITIPSTCVYGADVNEPAKIYLLRAPCSGSHWFFYCVNTLFQKAIHTEDRIEPYRADSYCNNKGKIVTAHNPYDLHLDCNSHNQDLLILLIRNYRECLLRNYKDFESVKNEIIYQASFNHLSHEKEWVLSLRMNHYFHNLRAYEMWNPGKRLIVYYEDLLENPRESLLRIAAFIGETGKDREIQTFVDHIDSHMENSINIYEGPTKVYTSHTRGRSFLYHTQKIGLEKSLELDELVMRCFPDFVKKYLSRYPLDSRDCN